jgi:hypothetical protein
MTSLYNHPKYQSCIQHAAVWEQENGEHYRNLLCLKPAPSTANDVSTVSVAHEKLAGKITETLEEVLAKRQDFLCVLPKGHTGQCKHKPHSKFITNDTIGCKLDWVYGGPGNNGNIYKNRYNRLDPIVVPDELEKKWKDKTVMLKCAIPLSEASTSFMMAAAYLDYITFLFNVEGIEEYINTDYEHLSDFQAIVHIHGAHLREHYARYDRTIFDEEGFTICPVTTDRIKPEHLANSDITDSSAVQLGHVVPRSETEFTIRGKNILFMTREGNRLVGDHVFTEDV